MVEVGINCNYKGHGSILLTKDSRGDRKSLPSIVILVRYAMKVGLVVQRYEEE